MLETLFGLSGRKALVLGSTPIGVASRNLMASASATVEIVDPGVDESAVDAVFADFAGRHGGLDILVYATTRTGTYPLTTMTLAQWDAVQDANLRGAFLAFRAAIPSMQARGGGAIIAISTMGSVHPVLKGNGAYGASKAGLNALVRAAALAKVPLPERPWLDLAPLAAALAPDKQTKGKGARRSGNPAKAAQEAAAAKEKAAQAKPNPFGIGEDVDYEAAAENLQLPKDFSKFLN